MDTHLLQVLIAHNPWLEAPSEQSTLLERALPRDFIPRGAGLVLKSGLCELVVGPRQAGKSTWIRSELAQVSSPVLMLNADESVVRELCRSAGGLKRAVGGLLGPETILFLEEVERVDDAALFLKALVDLLPNHRVVATGSASLDTGSGRRESLAGRARRTRVLPLSLQEVSDALPKALAPVIRELQAEKQWERLLVFGGYPDAWTSADPASVLHQLLESFVLRDVSDLHRIDNPSAFRAVLRLAAADAGNLVNVSSWAAIVSISRPTVDRYVEIARGAFILDLVPPFHGGRRAEVTGTSKVFFFDNGLRNAIYGGFGPVEERADRGALWENLVFAELSKRLRLLDELMFWRSKSRAEVDFVIRRGDRIVAIEVKAGTPRGVSRSGRSFCDAYQPSCFAVVNPARTADSEIGATPVLFRTPRGLDEILAHLGP